LAADLTALRYVPARFFGVFMSAHPALAALAGLVILGQTLAMHEWTGIGVVVLANALAIGLHRRTAAATQAPPPLLVEAPAVRPSLVRAGS
jgi:inner membrane transporter RhtA